jgi:lysophospholipase L1-like esterase
MRSVDLLRCLCLLLALPFVPIEVWAQEIAKLPEKKPETDRPAKWEKEIAAIEKRLAEKPPAASAIFFAGSSSIRLWKLETSFEDWEVANVGFGGSEVRDTTHFADRILLKFKPKRIVFYAGDNDINSGRTAAQVSDDFAAFAAKVHASLPETTIHFIAVKPSPSRWKKYDIQKAANAKIQELAAKDKRIGYIDIVAPMLGADGQPMADLFEKDMLHLNPKGYALWTEAVRKAVIPR